MDYLPRSGSMSGPLASSSSPLSFPLDPVLLARGSQNRVEEEGRFEKIHQTHDAEANTK